MQKQSLRKKLFKEFKAAFDKELYASSEELGRAYLKQYPRHMFAWLLYGITLRRLARYHEARLALQRVIKSKPEWLEMALSEMGRLYRAQGNLKKAADWFRKAIEAKPEATPSRNYLGSALVRQGLHKEAEECHRRTTECPEGDIDEAYFNLGLVLRVQGRYEEARQCCLKALELDPNYKDVKHTLKDLEQVIAYGQAAGSREAGLGSSEAPIRHVSGPAGNPKQKQNVQKKLFREFEVAWEKNLYAYHLELGKEYLKHYPQHLVARILYGIALRHMTRYHEARQALQYVIKGLSGNVHDWPLSEMGRIYASKGELKKAVDWYRKAIEAKPETTHSRIYLGGVLMRQGRLDEAEECHRRAMECSEGDVDEVFFNLGFVLRAQCRYEEARQSFLKALELEPRYKAAVKRLVKDLEQVLELQKKAEL